MTTFVVPRRSGASEAEHWQRPAKRGGEYDTEAIPVLIRLPDLNASTKALPDELISSAQTDGSGSPSQLNLDTDAGKQRGRRVDAKHEGPRQPHSTRHGRNLQLNVAAVTSNRFVVAGALAAVIVITYIAVQRRGPSDDPAQEAWTATNQPATPAGVEDWPSSDGVLVELPVEPMPGAHVPLAESPSPAPIGTANESVIGGTVQGLADGTATDNRATGASMELTSSWDDDATSDTIAEADPATAWPPGFEQQTISGGEVPVQLPRSSYSDPPTYDASYPETNPQPAIQAPANSEWSQPEPTYDQAPAQDYSNPYAPGAAANDAGPSNESPSYYEQPATPSGYPAQTQPGGYPANRQPIGYPTPTQPSPYSQPLPEQYQQTNPQAYPVAPSREPSRYGPASYQTTNPQDYPSPPDSRTGPYPTNGAGQLPVYRTGARPSTQQPYGARTDPQSSILSGDIQVPTPRATNDSTQSRY